MNRNDLLTLAQRLREYNHNPHHINPTSEAFHKLIDEAASALSILATPPADAADMGWQAGEEVEVVAWLSEVRSGEKTVIRASMSETSLEGMRRGYRDENAVIVRDDPCMTVAQHQRITAAMAAEVERLREERDSFQRVGILATEERDALRAELAITRRVIDRIGQLCTTPHESKERFIRRVQSVIEWQTSAQQDQPK